MTGWMWGYLFATWMMHATTAAVWLVAIWGNESEWPEAERRRRWRFAARIAVLVPAAPVVVPLAFVCGAGCVLIWCGYGAVTIWHMAFMKDPKPDPGHQDRGAYR